MEHYNEMKTGSLREILQGFNVVWVVEPCQIVLFVLDTVGTRRKLILLHVGL